MPLRANYRAQENIFVGREKKGQAAPRMLGKPATGRQAGTVRLPERTGGACSLGGLEWQGFSTSVGGQRLDIQFFFEIKHFHKVNSYKHSILQVAIPTNKI